MIASMTPAEADQRIILSRRTLASYVAMASAGDGPSPLDLTLIEDEIALLEAMAEEHPGKAAKLAALAGEWVAFRGRMRGKMH
jgi:hypothetical protein